MPEPIGKKYGNRAHPPRSSRTADSAAPSRKPRQRRRVGRYRGCPTAPELERELRAAYAAITAERSSGAAASRALYDAAEGYQHPHRYFLRRLLEGLEAGASLDTLTRPLRVIEQFLAHLATGAPHGERTSAV